MIEPNPKAEANQLNQSNEVQPTASSPDGPSSPAAGIVGGVCMIIVAVACFATAISLHVEEASDNGLQEGSHPLGFPVREPAPSTSDFGTKVIWLGVASLGFGTTWLIQGFALRKKAAVSLGEKIDVPGDGHRSSE
jgi:hypothetical protein